MNLLAAVERQIAKGGLYAPRWGWHDDHRAADGTDAYLPALMQVRDEYAQLLALLTERGALHEGASILQLGLGPCRASHDCWCLFALKTTTVDLRQCLYGIAPARYGGADTHSSEAYNFAQAGAPYDFLFIDAGHTYDDVLADHATYAEMVRPGGVIAFHDALIRPAYPEVGVPRYLASLAPQPAVIGTEVGIAWIIKE